MSSLAEQHQGWCKYYYREGGMPKNEACKKGVVYDELTHNTELGSTGCELRLPCLRSNHNEEKRRGQPLCECPHLQFPTAEESQAMEDDIHEHMKRMMIVEEAIRPLRKTHKGKNWKGVVECPVCKGNLHVEHHGYNGHCWVKCETENCVSWVE